MTETGQNYTMYQGETKRILIDVLDDDGNALDLTTYTIITWIVYKVTNKTAILTKTLGSGITVPTPSTGRIQIDIAPADTESVPASQYLHECEISDAAGDNISVVTTGTFKILYSKT